MTLSPKNLKMPKKTTLQSKSKPVYKPFKAPRHFDKYLETKSISVDTDSEEEKEIEAILINSSSEDSKSSFIDDIEEGSQLPETPRYSMEPSQQFSEVFDPDEDDETTIEYDSEAIVQLEDEIFLLNNENLNLTREVMDVNSEKIRLEREVEDLEKRKDEIADLLKFQVDHIKKLEGISTDFRLNLEKYEFDLIVTKETLLEVESIRDLIQKEKEEAIKDVFSLLVILAKNNIKVELPERLKIIQQEALKEI
jgi:hypothetical protein